MTSTRLISLIPSPKSVDRSCARGAPRQPAAPAQGTDNNLVHGRTFTAILRLPSCRLIHALKDFSCIFSRAACDSAPRGVGRSAGHRTASGAHGRRTHLSLCRSREARRVGLPREHRVT